MSGFLGQAAKNGCIAAAGAREPLSRPIDREPRTVLCPAAFTERPPIKRPERQITWPSVDWPDDIDTKTLGMLRVTQALLPHMPIDGTGRIVNISGIAGSNGGYAINARN